MTSIRRNLVISLVFAQLLGSLVMGAVAYLSAGKEIDDLFDKNLMQVALALQSQLEEVTLFKRDIQGKAALTHRRKLKGEEEFLIQIWDEHRNIVYASHPAIPFPYQDKRGLFHVRFQDRKWHVYAVHTPNGTVQVAQPLKLRAIMEREIAAKLMVPLVLQVPLMGLLIWLAIGRSLQPLTGISRAIQKRSAQAMEPLDENGLPEEIQPLVGALNSLLVRLKDAFEMQRRFVADAAHELRTPLTAISLQLNVLERSETGEERSMAITRFSSGVQRSIHLVHQLLTLARLEPEATTRPFTAVDLTALAREAVEQFAVLSIEKGVDLGFEGEESAWMQGDTENLRILLGNLLDNAIRYTPAGGKVDVQVHSSTDACTLEISDTGIGIPLSERKRVFDRFYRINRDERQGTGLGLAIVKSIAEQHQADIVLAASQKGSGTVIRISVTRD